jgi:hypothetical protein
MGANGALHHFIGKRDTNRTGEHVPEDMNLGLRATIRPVLELHLFESPTAFRSPERLC